MSASFSTKIPTILVALLLASCLNASAQTVEPLRIERVSETRWRITAEQTGPRVVTMPGEPPYSSVIMPGYEGSIVAGLPALPTLFLPFALPPDGSLQVRVISVTEDWLAVRLAPFGGPDVPAPPSPAWAMATPVTMRDGLRSSGVRVTPAIPGRDGLRWAKKLVLDVLIGGNVAPGAIANAAAVLSLREEFVNIADAGAWRVATRRLAAEAGPAAIRRAGDRYLAIRTREQGVYRITYTDLVGAGVAIAGLDPRTLRLTSEGVERPILVRGGDDGSFDSDDVIEFYAPRKQGESGEYLDEWSDENIFFIEWDGANGLRGGVEDVAPASWPQAQIVDAVPAVLHLEQDLEYHRGDFEYGDMQSSDRVPGETWMWSYLLKKDSLNMPFELDQPLQREATLEFRVKGASRDPSLLRITLNSITIFEDTLGSYDTTRLVVSVPPTALNNGANMLVFRNVGLVDCPPENPACSIERIYIDWAELRYQRVPALSDGTLEIDPAIGVGPPLPSRTLLQLPAPASALLGINTRSGAELSGIAIGASFSALAIGGDAAYHLFTEPLRPVTIDLREYQDLANPQRQADYIVITHSVFAAQARRLADYRAQSDGYTTLIADVEDLYDEFNHGHKNPVAIRDFLRTSWEQWSEPKPRFVLLLGDASWDAKFRKSNSTRTDYIPTYGNPASDNYYVRFSDNFFDPTPSVAIGRIPAENPSDADALIDKIMEYEALPPQIHDNRFLFSIGGENSFEQDLQLKPIAEALIINYVEPHCLEPRRIYKRTLTQVSYDDLDTLIHEVNQGVAWFLFAGHGGTRVIDVGVERPDIFSNKGKYPFFATISCNTAHFAEPFETGLNERFVMARENGSIASFGTAGLGIINYGYLMSRAMFVAMTDSAIRTYGELVHHGKLALIRHFGPGDQNTIYSVDQHCILGDPATRVPLALGPEMLAVPEDIRTDPDILTEQQRTRIGTTVRNVGMCMKDSVDVRLRVLEGGIESFSETRRIAAFSISAELEWEYDFAGVEGEVGIELTVDTRDEILEKREDNNIAILRKSVLPRGIAQIFPLDNAVLASGPDIDFVVANPSYVPEIGDPAVEIEISADADFMNGVRRLTKDVDDVYTTLSAGQFALDVVQYWRARMSVAGNPDRWSAVRSFRITPTITNEAWKQDARPQLVANDLDALVQGGDGSYALGMRPVQFEVTSGGFNGPFRFAILRVDRNDVSPNKRGMNCAVVEPVFGDVTATENFDTYLDAAEALRMLDFLRAIPDDHYLLAAVLDDANGYPPSSPNGSNLLPELKAELKRFGATLIDRVGYRDSYGFVGRRAAPQQAREMHFILGTVLFADTVQVRAREGRFTTRRIGPANAVTSLEWTGELPHSSAKVDLSIIGRFPDGRDTVFVSLANQQPDMPFDLGVLDCSAAPLLRVTGTLKDNNGAGSPVFRSLELRYVSLFPEIGVTSQVVSVDADSVLEGTPLAFDVRVHNAGRVESGPFDVALRLPGGSLEATPVRIANIAPGAAADVELTLPTTGVRGKHSYELSLDAVGTITEYYRANNAYSGSFTSGRDGATPDLEVLFDGAPIANNDFVRPQPAISIILRDASPLPVTDTSAVQVFLDNRRVWLLSDPAVQYTAGSTGVEKVQVAYTPTLSDGLHFLTVSGKDASGNAADTIPYQVRFYVSGTARVDQVLPWPSPTSGPMDFTYRCSGTDAPTAAEIRIYTVAGRLIRRIEAAPQDLRIGFNRIPWDGLDEDRDAIANGVYFYKLSVTQQGSAGEHIGRFSVLR